MQIKQLIQKLQELYDTYDAYTLVMGEPEIMIDVFESDITSNLYAYKGMSPHIKIDRSPDGVYDILNAFHEKYPKNPYEQASKQDTSPWPFPKSGDAHLKSSQDITK